MEVIEEIECPLCYVIINLSGVGIFEIVHCPKCLTNFEWDGENLIECDDEYE